ncbi:hypothetical protein [Streptomyces sp. T028]|uniref:hypothetical protein n=1 Tax=Streptomyces sp. T028 TaxID=3394379 RepID=UPI003A83C49B
MSVVETTSLPRLPQPPTQQRQFEFQQLQSMGVALPGGAAERVVSLTDTRGNVWDVREKKSYRPNGYWDTGYNTDSPQGDFVKNSKQLDSHSFDEIKRCTT